MSIAFDQVKEFNRFALRPSGDPLRSVNTVREIVRQADPRIAVTDIRTQAAQIDQTMNQQIIFAKLCTALATLSLLIACVGLYGTMAYGVARRTPEIGIRIALGAQRGDVIWMVLRQVFWLAATGLGIGVPVALGASKFVESFLFGVEPNDAPALLLQWLFSPAPRSWLVTSLWGRLLESIR